MINYLNSDVFEDENDLKNFKGLLDKNKSNLNFSVTQDLKVGGLLYFIDILNKELNLTNSNFDSIIGKVKIIVGIICRNKGEESEYFLENLKSKYNLNGDLVNQILNFEIKPTKENKKFINSIKDQRDEKNDEKLGNNEDFENGTFKLSKILSKEVYQILKNDVDENKIDKKVSNDLLLGSLFNEYEKISADFNLNSYKNGTELGDIMKKILKLDTKNSLQYFFKGNRFFNSGNYIDAIKSYDKYISIYPYNSTIYSRKGDCLYELGKLEEAVECYDKAIELYTNDSNLYFKKGETLYKLGDFKKAIECFDQSIKLDPNDATSYAYKGGCLNELGDFEKSVECFNKVVEIEPIPEQYCNKGICLLNLGKYEECMECFDIAISLDPNYNNSYLYKLILFGKLGKINEIYKQILTIENSNKKLKKLIRDNDIDGLNSYLLKLK